MEAVSGYHPLLEQTAATLCNDIVKTLADFCAHVKLAVGRIILSTIYGIEVESKENEDVEAMMEWVVDNAVPGKHLCDMFPWMVYLPKWLPFHRLAQHGKDLFDRTTERPFDYVKQQMMPCFISIRMLTNVITGEWNSTTFCRSKAA